MNGDTVSSPRKIKRALQDVLTGVTAIIPVEEAFESTDQDIEVSVEEVRIREGRPDLFPSIVLAFTFVDQDEYETGGGTDNNWRVRVRILFDLTRPESAQDEYDFLFPEILAALRRNQDLNGTCDMILIEDGGDPDFNGRLGILAKTIYVSARKEEY